MAQQNLNIGLSREQIRAAVQADFVELYAALNSAYGTNLVPRLLNSGLLTARCWTLRGPILRTRHCRSETLISDGDNRLEAVNFGEYVDQGISHVLRISIE